MSEQPLGFSETPPAETAAPSAPLLVRYSRRAMACEFAVLLDPVRYPHGAAAALAALNEVDHLEELLTVYRPESQISRINARGYQEPVPVEPEVMEVLRLAKQLWEQTQGAFDITTGALSKAWGFFRRQGRMPPEAELQEALTCTGSQHLLLEPEQRTVRLAQPGVELNLGSIGKGYALDVASRKLLEAQVQDFLFHGGRSSVLARGSQDPRDPQQGFWIGIAHPLMPDRRLARVRLCNAALGTSGCGTQFFHHQGRRYAHVLDPRTGEPVHGVFSVTVRSPTAVLADALATAFFVLGPEEARRFCQQRPELALFMLAQGRGQSYRIVTCNWAEGDLVLEKPFDRWVVPGKD